MAWEFRIVFNDVTASPWRAVFGETGPAGDSREDLAAWLDVDVNELDKFKTFDPNVISYRPPETSLEWQYRLGKNADAR